MTAAKSEDQAKSLADSYRQADPSIESVLWFPDDEEIRLLLVSPDIGPSFNDPEVHPFYFRPSELEDTASASGVAYISPQEIDKIRLPKAWGSWSDAVAL
jgi:hypothetical protein